MGSISSSLSSLASPVTTEGSSSSSGSSNYFTGSSAYSSDLENVISRAVELASMPIQLLSNQQTALSSQSSELTTLGNLFGNLQTAVAGVDSAMNGASFQASYSNDNVVNATLSTGATPGVYSINVSQMGVNATSLSSSTWNSAPATGGGASPYTLVVGGNEYSFTPASNSAQDVAAAINSQFSSLVQATAVNVGTSSSPDYRISLRSNTYGPMNLDLVQMPQSPSWTSLQQAASPASYSTSLSTSTWNASSLNGDTLSLVIGGNSQNITISNDDDSAQGVAADINAQFGTQVQATVVNQGTSSSPDYRISLQSATPSAEPLDIQYTPSGGGSATSLQTQGAGISYSTSLSQNTWTGAADPAGTRTMYQLVVGSTTLQFAPPDNTAAGVASYINSKYGTQVQATVVNQGTTQNPEYQISLRSATPGTSTNLDIQTVEAASFQSPQTTGQVSQYSIDGGPTVSSASESVNVSNGITLNLQGEGSTDVTVSSSVSALSSALSSFASAYNAVVTELDNQRGQSGGPLQGDPIVSELEQTLNSIGTYLSTGSGSANSLASLGLTFDSSNNGNLDYDPTVLESLDASDPTNVATFLGSASGGGFLGSATNALNGLTTPVTGLLATDESSLQSEITDIGNQITTKQNQVNQLQSTLTTQMATADSSLAAMEQQYSELSQMYSAQNTANLQYANGG
jgi:flagellar hook-associated protein 2